MFVERASIAQVMAFVALAAVNLGVFRALPLEVVRFPTLWVFLGAIDVVIFRKLICVRSLRAFHYTFLIVFVLAWIVMANLVVTARFHPLGLLVQWYQQITTDKINVVSLDSFDFYELWMTCFLSFALAVAIGLVAAWFESRRNWDIAACLRGALAGFGIANLLAVIDGAVWGWGVVSPVRMVGRLILVGVCVILGGVVGLSKLKSNTPGRRVP
ncbi:hypothetical protein [Singulisphaera acidiphila]|uniref:Uncharacterized protein n=1 Tax=Singulisphaera acidiphila (strain ATCC BAA-1392 / DSM 18658 / VKM B-2454 / MOB10) TaxID=886293 RepID=L0DI32_SINAD|nr:hypothetical protein [Singulisphaera acidiphila]AGA28468.1 hypothetical protein Sinac_4269 [Singulisphaera acidiphila DSM 18658]